MASEMIDRSPRAESHTLRMEEERLRTYLSDRFGISTRFAPLSDVRAFLVSPPNDGRDKGLVVSSDATVAERIYLYLHVAAHLALGHHLPLATIVEGVPGITRLDGDVHAHLEAEKLARVMWWGRVEQDAVLWSSPLVRRSTVLRTLLARDATRSALRSLLMAMRAAYYDLRIERALAGSRMAAWLRDALCVTAVVSVAPQLSD
jgi:hypothetical protein